MQLPVILPLLVHFASAVTTSSFCASAKSCPKSAATFCSSYLHIPAKTTTVAPTVTTTRTSTLTSGVTTTTATTGTSTYTFTNAQGDFISSTTTITDTNTYTTTVCTYSYFTGGCTFTGTDPNAPQKRAVTPSTTRPSCLNSYSSGTALSSACKCLSIPTSTSTITRGKTTTKTATKIVTKAKFTTTVRTKATTTATVTSVYTETLTYTDLIQPTSTVYAPSLNKEYYLENGPSGDLSNFVSTSPNGALGIQFSQTYAPHADYFYLGYYEDTPCVLSSEGGSAPYAFIGATGDDSSDLIEFSSDPVPADQLVVCVQQSYTQQLFCKNPKGERYNAGYVDGDAFWHIPVNDSRANAQIFAPYLGGSACSADA